MKLKELEKTILKELNSNLKKFATLDDAIIETIENLSEDYYFLDHYTSWPDGRGGDILSAHFKIDNKYYCCMFYDKNLINLKEITKEIYEKDNPFN